MPQRKRPPKGTTREFDVDGNDSVELEIIELYTQTTRVEVRADARWLLDIENDGSIDVIATYDEQGNLADVPLPEWLPTLLEKLGLQEVEIR